MSSICLRCQRKISDVDDGDLRNEYANRADVLGENSLTETQQMLVNGYLCEECYEEIN